MIFAAVDEKFLWEFVAVYYLLFFFAVSLLTPFFVAHVVPQILQEVTESVVKSALDEENDTGAPFTNLMVLSVSVFFAFPLMIVLLNMLFAHFLTVLLISSEFCILIVTLYFIHKWLCVLSKMTSGFLSFIFHAFFWIAVLVLFRELFLLKTTNHSLNLFNVFLIPTELCVVIWALFFARKGVLLLAKMTSFLLSFSLRIFFWLAVLILFQKSFFLREVNHSLREYLELRRYRAKIQRYRHLCYGKAKRKESCYILGNLYYKRKHESSARVFYQKACQLSHRHSCKVFFNLLRRGCFEKRSREDCYRLGKMFETGNGARKDIMLAVSLYVRSLHWGQKSLARLYSRSCAKKTSPVCLKLEKNFLHPSIHFYEKRCRARKSWMCERLYLLYQRRAYLRR